MKQVCMDNGFSHIKIRAAGSNYAFSARKIGMDKNTIVYNGIKYATGNGSDTISLSSAHAIIHNQCAISATDDKNTKVF